MNSGQDYYSGHELGRSPELCGVLSTLTRQDVARGLESPLPNAPGTCFFHVPQTDVAPLEPSLCDHPSQSQSDLCYDPDVKNHRPANVNTWLFQQIARHSVATPLGSTATPLHHDYSAHGGEYECCCSTQRRKQGMPFQHCTVHAFSFRAVIRKLSHATLPGASLCIAGWRDARRSARPYPLRNQDYQVAVLTIWTVKTW